MSYYVYILRSERNGSYYIGQTSDIADRLGQHNKGHVRSTKAGQPWKLMYQESFFTRSEAIRREREIKGRKGREFVDKLILSNTERGAVPPPFR